MSKAALIVGNWKMYKGGQEALATLEKLTQQIPPKGKARVLLAVPFITLPLLAHSTHKGRCELGAQNMHDASEGAFTGEIAGEMLLEAGATFVILGHSERRHLFGEENPFINRKVLKALEVGLFPILCVGETLEEREEGRTEEVLETQLLESLKGVGKLSMRKMAVAYEPVWAIGTGRTASPEIAQKVHAYLREVVAEHWSPAAAASLPLLYGGSVKPENADSLLVERDINGLLVGGASLNPESFAQIVQSGDQVIV